MDAKMGSNSGTGMMNQTQLQFQDNPLSRLSLRMTSPTSKPFSEDLFGDPSIIEQLTRIASKKQKQIAKEAPALGTMSSHTFSTTSKFS
mmetsp:Transcript_4968/g.7434  ORF Transcript_4968/g.7434 Transcript_4968/m.7434 type:complete len:89 (+) Transcript_4968:22-288(+)